MSTSINSILTGYQLASSGGGGGGATVQPPSPTSQRVASSTTSITHTFGAFTDSGGIIDGYSSAIIAAQGSPSASGSGLGAYTVAVSPGNSFSLLLNALKGSDIVATAVHAVLVEPPGAYDAVFRSFGFNPPTNLQSTYIAFTGSLS